jgi:pimeloyl-ACP methyl ester carboxylesterase
MGFVMGRFLLVLFSFWAGSTFGALSPDKFKAAYESYLAGEAVEISPQNLESYDYLFFAGFGGENLKPLSWFGRGYFDGFRKDLVKQGVAAAQVPATYYPPSHRGIWENAGDFIATSVMERFQQTGRKQVLFGHSKGAAELFAFAVTHPQFIEEHVEAVFLFSGAIQGSALANLATFRPTAPVGLPLFAASSAAALVVAPYINFFCRAGALSLCMPTAQQQLALRMRSDPDGLKAVLKKSLFVQTSVKGLDRAPAIWLPDAFLSSEAGEPSDGIVVLSAQLPPDELAEPQDVQKVHLEGVNHFFPCPRLLSMYYFSRIPKAISLAALAAF